MKDSIRCSTCGKTFEVAHRRDQTARFCSRPCWAADWAVRQTGTGNVAKLPGVGARISAAHRSSGRFRAARHPNWKGGEYMEGQYMYVRVGVDAYRKRSHVVWDDAHPDDPIRPGEVIHHMNHVKTDDRPENLMKLASQSDHALEHGFGSMGRRGWPEGRPNRPGWTPERRQRQREAMARHRGPDGRFA